jgi:hypothetical protein
MEMISNFQNLSEIVQTTIATREKVKERVEIIKIWTKIAENLRKLNNFHSTYAIMTGLEHGSIMRLKNTWQRFQKKKKVYKQFIQIQELVSSTGNFRNLQGALKSTLGPCIPVLGCLLDNLKKADEILGEFRGYLIPMTRFRIVGNILDLQFRAQNEGYEFHEIPNFWTEFEEEHVVIQEKDLYKISTYLEPRAGHE